MVVVVAVGEDAGEGEDEGEDGGVPPAHCAVDPRW